MDMLGLCAVTASVKLAATVNTKLINSYVNATLSL